MRRARGSRPNRLAVGVAVAGIEVGAALVVLLRPKLAAVLHAAHWAERIELQLELCRYLSLRNVLALWVSVTTEEPAEAAPSLRHLAAVLRATHWAREAGTLKRWRVAGRRIVANHLRE